MEDIDELANGDNDDGISFFLCVCGCACDIHAPFSLFFFFEGAMLTETRPAEIGKLTTLQSETVRTTRQMRDMMRQPLGSGHRGAGRRSAPQYTKSYGKNGSL
jgi:hypothetical protein